MGIKARNRIKICLLVLIAFWLVPSGVYAAIFHVRAGAAGANDGSDWNNAWTDLNQVNFDLIQPGDSIYIAGGTYGPLVITKSGVSGNPIMFKRATASSHGSDVGWLASFDARVIIDGQDNTAAIAIGAGGDWSGQSYLTIDGVTRYGIWLRNAFYGVHATREPGNHGLTLRNLEIGDGGDYKIDEDGVHGRGDDLLIEHCYIHDNDDVIARGDGIQWFEGNRVTIRYNLMKNNGQQLALGESNFNSVVNDLSLFYNVIYNRGGNHLNGIVMFGNASQSGRFVNVYNNTFDLEAVDGSGPNSLFYPITGSATINFVNNAVHASNAAELVNTVHGNNAFDNSGLGLVFNIPVSESGQVVAASLAFLNASTGDYRISSASPLYRKGVNVGLTMDFAGRMVPATPSIGAFEFGTNLVVPAPTNLRVVSIKSN